MSPRLAGSSHKALLQMLLGPIVPSHLVAAWWPLLAPFPPLASDFLVDILKTSKHIMSVYGVVCVLGPDRGCVVEAHGVVSPFFLQGLPVFYWVPRIGPGISPGQPSILRQGMPDIRLIGGGGGSSWKSRLYGGSVQATSHWWSWTYKMPSLADTPSLWQDVKDADPEWWTKDAWPHGYCDCPSMTLKMLTVLLSRAVWGRAWERWREMCWQPLRWT